MPRRTLSLCPWYQGCFGSSSAAPGLGNFHFRQMPPVDSRDRRKSARRPAPLRGCQAIRQSQSSQPRTGFHCHEASGQSAGGVDFMSIRSWAGAHCFVAASKTPDVLTRQLFHVLKKRQGILTASQSGRGHAIPGLRKAVLENLEIIPHPSRNRR